MKTAAKFVVIIAALCGVWRLSGADGTYSQSPHGSSLTGVLRTGDNPRGSCAQCHKGHDGGNGYPFGLFQENSNRLCFSQSMGGCHADRPAGATSGYPAQESDRMPLGSSDPGYFEFNSGGIRVSGTHHLVRWPGQIIWENTAFSSHYSDPDMPLKDALGFGSCDNCHDVHGGSGRHDMLDTTYSGIVGSQTGFTTENYLLCFTCHSVNGPVGMDESSRYIADYYDRSVNPGTRTGHGLSHGGSFVPSGARLPCFDCHNPHGSEGYNGQGSNGYLLSDQRPGWYGLNNIKEDNIQVRRFCFGCHPSSDGQGGGSVEGITPRPLPGEIPDHAFNGARHCYDCHGRDYSGPNANNVHNPSEGEN